MRSVSPEHGGKKWNPRPSLSLVSQRVERTGDRASPLGKVVDVETPRRPLASTSCPLVSAAVSVLALTGSSSAQAAGAGHDPSPHHPHGPRTLPGPDGSYAKWAPAQTLRQS